MRQSEIKSFLNEYASGNYDEAQHERFMEWLDTAPARDIEEVIEAYRSIAGKQPLSGRPHPEIILQIEAALDRLDDPGPGKQIGGNRLTRKRSRIPMAAAAAVILVGLFISGYWGLHNKPTKNAGQPSLSSSASGEISAPRSTKATIVLSNGQVVALDSLQEGVLAVQGAVNIIKTDTAGIVYKKDPVPAHAGGAAKYNTLYNPKGSAVVSLVLGDGTRVWLNAASSLRYPVSFSGKERKVEITGEAYFEVAKDANRQFLVDAGGAVTKVLGTQFNIKAYQEEGQTVVTLLEGAVRVEESGSSAMLRPGQQAIAAHGVRMVDHADTESAIAWKNGEFIMKSADVGSVMRQVARWYNVDVIYEAGIPQGSISGEVSRNLNLSQIVQVLRYSGIHIRTEGRTVIVMP